MDLARSALSTVIKRIGRTLLVKVDDYMFALEGTLLRHLGDTSVRIALRSAGPNASLLVWTAVAKGLLADDGDGTVEYNPDWNSWPILDYKLHLMQAEGSDRTIVFSCKVSNIPEYVRLSVGGPEDDALVGVPMRMMLCVERRWHLLACAAGTAG